MKFIFFVKALLLAVISTGAVYLFLGIITRLFLGSVFGKGD